MNKNREARLENRRCSQDSGMQRLQDSSSTQAQRKPARNEKQLSRAKERATGTEESACNVNRAQVSDPPPRVQQNEGAEFQQSADQRPSTKAPNGREQRAQSRGQQNSQKNTASIPASPSIVPSYETAYTQHRPREPIHITPRGKTRTAEQTEQGRSMEVQKIQPMETQSQRFMEPRTAIGTIGNQYRNLTGNQTKPACDTDDIPNSRKSADDVRRSDPSDDPSEDPLDDDSLEGSESHLRAAGTPGEIPA